MPIWIRQLFFRIVLCRRLTGIYDRIWPRRSLGERGELEAERFLLKAGLIIVERGYQDKLGEIDLIAVEDRTVVFVEVKTRTGSSPEDATEAVDDQKQAQISRTAKGFLKWHHLQESPVRFDVIGVLWQKQARPQIVHYRSAFETPGDFQLY